MQKNSLPDKLSMPERTPSQLESHYKAAKPSPKNVRFILRLTFLSFRSSTDQDVNICNTIQHKSD